MTDGRPAGAARSRRDPQREELMMPIERPLLDILACPIDKQGLLYFEDEAILYNPRLRRDLPDG